MNIIGSLFTPEAIIALVTVFTGGLFLFLLVNKDFTIGIYIWLLSILFLRFQKISFSGSMLPDVSMARFLFIALLVMFILEAAFGKHKVFRWTLTEYSMSLFLLLAIISMMSTGLIIKEGGRFKMGELLTGYIFPFFMFFISQSVYNNPEKREGLIKFLILTGIYLGITAVFEHFNADKFIFPKYIMDPGFGIHFGRARGPFGQAAVNGTVLGFALCSSFYFLLIRKRKNIWILFSLILLAILPLAIFFTYTRAVWLASVLSFTLVLSFAFKEKKAAITFLIVILCLAAVIAMPFILNSNTVANAFERINDHSPIDDRLSLYTVYLSMFKEHPFMGIGFDRFSEVAPDYYGNVNSVFFKYGKLSPHDTFANVLGEMGISGALLILGVYLSIIFRSIKIYSAMPEIRSMLVVFWGCVIVYIVNSVFIEMRYFEFVNSLFFIFAGAICRAGK
jgi:O-antigen ligase